MSGALQDSAVSAAVAAAAAALGSSQLDSPHPMEEPVPCRVRVQLDPPTALRVVAALSERDISPSTMLYMRDIFKGTGMAHAVLTICSALDKTRLENIGCRIRLILKLAPDFDDGAAFELGLTLNALEPTDEELLTPERGTSEGDGSDGGASTAGSPDGGRGAFVLRRAPNSI